MKLAILLAKASQFEKLATESDVPEVAQVKQIIKTSLEDLFREYPTIMDGFLYMSNFNMSLAENWLTFTVNFDKSKSESLSTNKTQRDAMIHNTIKTNLKNTLGQGLNLDIKEMKENLI